MTDEFERLKETGKKLGSRVLFELALEYFHSDLIKAFQQYLAPFTAEEIPEHIRKNEFPPPGGIDFNRLHPYAEYLEQIGPIRIMEEYLAEARPDIAIAIQNMGEAGAIYIVALRQAFLELVKHPEKVKPLEQAKDTVLAVCEKCKKSWPVAQADFQNINQCPFCKASAKDETSPAIESS